MKTDTPHILCVNPWIHDFAAFDFWLTPLGLLSLAAILRENGMGVSYVDCLNRFHPRRKKPVKMAWDGRGPFLKTPVDWENVMPEGVICPHDIPNAFCRYGIEPDWFREDLKKLEAQRGQPDLIFVTSLMTYWASGAAETIAILKEVFPRVPVVLGGKYASLCPDHAKAHSGADIITQGPGETALNEIFTSTLGAPLENIPHLNEMDAAPFPALDLIQEANGTLPHVPLITSRGCPFSCEYCASSVLEPRMRERSPDKIFEEICHWHQNYGVQNFALYDDAFLIHAEKRAFPLMEKLIAAGLNIHLHTPNALHIREITPKAADLMFRSGFKTIRMGLETTDFSKERHHDHKVKAGEFARALDALKKAGFTHDQVGAYLLCGLPGQDPEEVAHSMEQVRKMDIIPTLAFYTPIPQTPVWPQALASARFDIGQHPVFTNNSLFPCVPRLEDRQRISQLKKLRF